MIFISFGANAINVGKMYKTCLVYKVNGFDIKKMSDEQKISSFSCASFFSGVVILGYKNCVVFRFIFNQNRTIDKKTVSLISREVSNHHIPDIRPVITSFINFAENNTQYWEEGILEHSDAFISSKFPCDLKKP